MRSNKRKAVELQRKDMRAGPPTETATGSRKAAAFENRESVSFASFLDTEGFYVFKVRDESMIDDHIMEGDCVLIQEILQVRNDEIAAVSVDNGETTLKRFYREGSQVRLQPANRKMEPTVIPAERIRIQGRVLAVHRRCD